MHTTFQSGGRPIRLTCIEPSSPGPHPALLLLHGAGGNTDLWLDRLTPHIARLHLGVYAVHYFDRTGTTRASPTLLADGHHVPLWLHTLRDTLAHLVTRPAVDPARIALLGISLGAFLALALAAENSATTPSPNPAIKALVDISGGLAPPWDTRASTAFPPTLILHGKADSVVPVSFAHALDRTLTRLAAPHQLHILPNEGHWFAPAGQLRLLALIAAFLTQHL